MDKPVIIFGAKGLTKPTLEIFKSNRIVVYGILDDDAKLHGSEVFEIPVLGGTDDHGYLKLIGQKCEAFISTDSNEERKDLVAYLTETRKVMPMNALHATATISDYASIGHGNFINANAFLGSDTKIGNHNLINSRVSIDHDVKVGDYVQIGSGTIVNSGAEIGDEVFIGSGVTIVSGIKVADGARIGAGSVVVQPVKEKETVFGNPAVAVDK